MKILSSANFATLHNEETIFYSHVNDLNTVFNKISQKNHDVILITGAGDLGIDNFHAPENVKYWFAQNALSNDKRIIPIPIGMCNGFEVHIPGQQSIGCGGTYEYCDSMSQLLIDAFLNDTSFPTEFIYANFTIGSNEGYRSVIKDISVKSDFINFEGPEDVGFISGVGKYSEENGNQIYLQKILNHQAILSPIGAGIDTHRLWEALYCKRIPITINANAFRHERVNQSPHHPGEAWLIPPLHHEYSIYTQLYSKLPIVVLNSYRELFDKPRLERLIEEQKQKDYDTNLLDFNYWKDMILDYEKTLLL